MKDYRAGELQKDLESIDNFYVKNPELNVIPVVPQIWEERIQNIAAKIASTLNRKTVTNHEHYREMLAKEPRYHLAAEIKTAQEEVVREILKEKITSTNSYMPFVTVFMVEQIAKKYGLNISDNTN